LIKHFCFPGPSINRLLTRLKEKASVIRLTTSRNLVTPLKLQSVSLGTSPV
ncbi:hypothetical protein T05_7646, partial [Trichinella murrelli]